VKNVKDLKDFGIKAEKGIPIDKLFPDLDKFKNYELKQIPIKNSYLS
jgi:hypothetical protein